MTATSIIRSCETWLLFFPLVILAFSWPHHRGPGWRTDGASYGLVWQKFSISTQVSLSILNIIQQVRPPSFKGSSAVVSQNVPTQERIHAKESRDAKPQALS
jgi:hypothetical protein